MTLKKKWRAVGFITIICFLSMILYLGLLAQPVHALTPDESADTVFGRAYPQGLADTTALFEKGTIANNVTEFRPLDNGSAAILLTTGKTSQFGSVWSNVSAGNYIDLSKRQTLSMWMYFGKKQYNAGDGMAFVMQNDPRGIDAFAQDANGNGVGGETLGVWGSTIDGSLPPLTASRAIQNSWALEFDTYANPAPDSDLNNLAYDNKFDLDLYTTDYTNNTNHIASNYPGLASAYGMDLSLKHLYPFEFVDKYPGNTLLSKDHRAFLSNGYWRHLQLRWDPTDQTMTYTFDDIFFGTDDGKDGEPSPKYTVTRTMPIDTANFNLPAGDTKMRWGFTGSTGAAIENNFIIFESIPSLVEGDAKAQITDVTQNKVLTSKTAADNAVISGDTMNVQYQLSYLSGTQSWQNIAAHVTLPDHIAYTSAKVTYPNTTKPEETIDLSGLTDRQITHKLAQVLDHNTTRANIDFVGTATGGTSEVTVDEETTHIIGSNLIEDATTVPFVIKVAKPLTIATTQNTVRVNRGEAATLPGTVRYEDGSALSNDQVTLHATVAGQTEPVTALASAGSSTNGVYQLAIPADLLKVGQNTVTVYAKDAAGNKSNSLSYTVNVLGIVSLTASKTVDFNRGMSGTASQLLGRKGTWSVRLLDTRGSGEDWTVQASATDLYQGDTKLNGAIVYINANGTKTPLTENTTAVATGTKVTNDTTDTEVTSVWTEDTGLFLETNGTNHTGAYSGTITWTATESIQ